MSARRPRACSVPGCDRAALDGSRTVRCLPHLTGHPAGTAPPARPARPDPTVPGTLVRRGARDTSSGAALRALPRSGTARARVLEALRERGEYGATDDELCQLTGLQPNTLRPRRVELVTAGWCADSGVRRLTPQTSSPAAAWRYVP